MRRSPSRNPSAHARTRRLTETQCISPDFIGSRFAAVHGVIWFLEKKDDLLVCEIRRAAAADGYEFEIADAKGPRTIRCQSPTELIAKYLDAHTRLMRDGWRPRAGSVTPE